MLKFVVSLVTMRKTRFGFSSLFL